MASEILAALGRGLSSINVPPWGKAPVSRQETRVCRASEFDLPS